MVLYGLLADKQLFADFFVAEALRDELYDFLFAVAEERLFAARAGLRGFGESLHDLGSHAVIETNLARVDEMNAFSQQFRSGLLEDHAPGAEAHGADDVAVVFGGGEDDDAGWPRVEIDFLEDRQAIFVRHTQIEQEDVGLQFGEELNALRAVLSFADDDDVLVGAKKLAQAVAENGVVIRQ